VNLQLGVALLTVRDENGFYGVQHEPFGGAGAAAPQDDLHHAYGFKGRPLDADANGRGCALWYDFDGKDGLAFLGYDPRIADKIPPVKKGGSVQYGSDGSFALFDPETRTWTLYVPYAESPAKAHLVTVGKDGNGTPIVEHASGEGPSYTMLGRVTTIKNADGSAYLVLDDNGTSVVGPFKAASGADLGGPASMALTKFAPLSTELTAIQTALNALTAAVTALADVPVNSAAGGAPAAAAAAAVLAAVGALATFNAAGTTLTTKGA
jgi:hypothetical protein